MDAAWLERVALRHVERWEATQEGIRRVLERRIRRRCGRTGESPEEALGWIEDLLSPIVSECLAEDRGEDELEAAWQAARRRRLGPYCRDPERREAERERHLAILGRRGFSFEIARQVVEARDLPEPG
jgi:regulatory protein